MIMLTHDGFYRGRGADIFRKFCIAYVVVVTTPVSLFHDKVLIRSF